MELRPIEEKDLDTLRALRNDVRIYRWCRQTTLISPSSHVTWYNKQANDPSILMRSIVDGEKLLGVCGLTSIDHIARRAEFSLYIDPECQGKGLGMEALSALLSLGFQKLNLNLIWGETFAGNPAIKLFEKLGFVKEGTRRQFYYKDGIYVDAHLYSITRKDLRFEL